MTLTAPIIGATIGAIIGTRIGHLVVGAMVGAVLGAVLTWVAHIYFLDECDCIWWWISTLFMDWLTENAWSLTIKYITNPSGAQAEIMCAFLGDGYLRVGAVTFYDVVGAGNPQFSYTLTISAGSGGTTEPPSGTYDYSYGESETVTASAYSIYEFDYWILDGTIMYENPITVTMNSDHTLKAYFQYSGGGGGGGSCPTLFVWNGSDYVDYGVIDIHNPTSEDVIREVSIQAEDVAINKHKAVLRFREGWEGLNFSESVIDQVKLYTVDDDDNRYLCPLISAEHSRLGNVLPQLLKSDDYRVQTLLLETTDLTFTVPYQNIQSFTFVIEGCNREKTIK